RVWSPSYFTASRYCAGHDLVRRRSNSSPTVRVISARCASETATRSLTSGLADVAAKTQRTRFALSLSVAELTRHLDKSSPYGPARALADEMTASRAAIPAT